MKKILFLLLALLTLEGTQAQTIRDSRNAMIGKVESNGTIRDSRNAMVGKVESNGTVRDSRNAMVGRIESNGTIRDSRNAMIGTAPGVAPRVAAVLFFMNLLILR